MSRTKCVIPRQLFVAFSFIEEMKQKYLKGEYNNKQILFYFQSTLWPVIMQQMFGKGDAHN